MVQTPNSNKMTLGQRLRFARKKRGMTQEQLGWKVGMCQTTIGDYERDKHDPVFFTITCLADALEVSLDWLAGRGSDRWQDLN